MKHIMLNIPITMWDPRDTNETNEPDSDAQEVHFAMRTEMWLYDPVLKQLGAPHLYGIYKTSIAE